MWDNKMIACCLLLTESKEITLLSCMQHVVFILPVQLKINTKPLITSIFNIKSSILASSTVTMAIYIE